MRPRDATRTFFVPPSQLNLFAQSDALASFINVAKYIVNP